jgi:hypothetical protein
MNARMTVFGFVPAKLNTLVMSIRSMFVLLSALDSVKPPMSSIIVGENITEKMYLTIKALVRNIEGNGV